MLGIKNETTATNSAENDTIVIFNEDKPIEQIIRKLELKTGRRIVCLDRRLEPYQQRMVDEYYEVKDRYEKLKAFINRIDAANITDGADNSVEMPKHDCPAQLLYEQKSVMGEYLKILELRAVIEKVEL